MNRSEQDSGGERTYQIISEIGHGAQGSVYLVRDAITRQVYAAKVVISLIDSFSFSTKFKIDSTLRNIFCTVSVIRKGFLKFTIPRS